MVYGLHFVQYSDLFGILIVFIDLLFCFSIHIFFNQKEIQLYVLKLSAN